MSNFFRETSISFKPRSNIFSKLRVKDPEVQYDNCASEDVSSSMLRDDSMSSIQHENDGTPNTTAAYSYKKKDLCKPAASTPENSREYARIRYPLEEDDVEITEIRGVLEGSDSKTTASTRRREHDGSTEISTDECRMQPIDSSSNDVLLEAFTNTQKLCSSLRQELQRQRADNLKLKTQLSSQQIDCKKMTERFAEYKDLLSSLEEKSASLIEQKLLSDANLKELRENYAGFEKRIDVYKGSVSELQRVVADFRAFRNSADSEIISKSKEIEYLKSELNNCSGHLSEEKLKNSSLLQELSEFRTEVLDNIMGELTKGERKMEDNFEHLKNDFAGKLQLELKSQLSCSNPISFVVDGINALQDSMDVSVKEYSKRLEDKSLLIDERLIKKIHKENEVWHENFLVNTGNNIVLQGKCVEEIIAAKFGELKVDISAMNDVSTELIKTLTQTFTKYREEMTNCEVYNSKINSLQSEISSLQLQKSQALSSLGTREAQYEEIAKIVDSKNCEISKYIDMETEMRKKLESINDDLQLHKNKLVKVTEESMMLKANSENKIVVQNELLKALQSENDILRTRSSQQNSMKDQIEKESSSKGGKIKLLNEKLQKQNVEMVQLKAHELELDEENGNLKKTIDDIKLEHEEMSDELKLLEQKLIVFRADKQDLIRDKLDLQDRIDELQKAIKKLKQISKLDETAKSKNTKPSDFVGSNPLIRDSFISNDQTGKPDPSKLGAEALEGKCDEFDLSSSLNDDLEMTNPSPIEIKTVSLRKGSMKPPKLSKKKLLLLDEDDSTQLKHRWKKRKA